MRLRAFALLVLLASPLVAGCFDDEPSGPRLAIPTNVTAGPKPPPVLSNPIVILNFSDPGYELNTSWHVGDGWDWESNHSRFRTLRVLEERQVGNRTHYLVEETFGRIGQLEPARTRAWVESGTWRQLNATTPQGYVTTYSPGIPLRHTWNGSYTYTTRFVDAQGRLVDNSTVYANVAYSNNDVVIRLPWGNVATAKFEHRIVTVGNDNSQTRTQVTRWMSRDYATDVQYMIDLDETYKLTAAKVGGRTYREPRAT